MTLGHNRRDRILLTVLVLTGLAISALAVTADWLGIGGQPGFGLKQTLVLVSGIALSLISWWFLRSAHANVHWVWPVILLSLLILGFAIRFVEITNDPLDFDEYACMLEVDQSFPTYVKGPAGSYGFPLLVHYWLSYRLLGGSLLAYRTMSLFASVSLLLLTTLCLRRFWPSEKAVCLIALSVLILNGNTLYLTRYSMFTYGNGFLVSAGLFFLFMRLAEGPIEKRKWLWISAIILPAAFFSNIIMMVPLATGILSVIVFRWWRFADSRNLAALWRWIWELKPLLVFPLTYAATYILFPFGNLGADKRPDMAPLFFPTSGYSYDFLEVMKFVLTRTYSLFKSMLVPVAVPMPVMTGLFTKAVVASWGFLAALTIVQSVRRRADQRTVFAVFFLLTTLVSILGASLLGLYPYGRVRYTPYLLMPTAILIGFGGSLVYRWISQRLMLARSPKALLTFSAVVVLIAGSYTSVGRYNGFASTRESNDQAMNWARTQKPDLILADSYIMCILSAKAPEVRERAHSMGWGTYWGKDVVPPELVDEITGTGQPQPVDSVLVILHYKDIGKAFPRWNTLLGTYFNLDTWVESPAVWAGLYRRKAHDSAPGLFNNDGARPKVRSDFDYDTG